ncbi:hypothetical protein GMMP13_440008 [Candidatus Magnetomoraceae bacterium gMMP-13]
MDNFFHFKPPFELSVTFFRRVR